MASKSFLAVRVRECVADEGLLIVRFGVLIAAEGYSVARAKALRSRSLERRMKIFLWYLEESASF